jgi:hypothetical protein
MSSDQAADESKREQRLKLLDDHIGRALAESQSNGELAAAPSFGKPLDFGDGYDETPAELRLPFKMLKDAGYVPPEVEAMRQIAALQSEIDAAPTGPAAETKRRQVIDLRQALALRLEKLRLSGSL